jgi:hypothetical protein
LTEIKGAVYLDTEFLVLDMEVASWGGLQKKDRIIKIEPKALDFVSFRRGLVKDQICLRPKSETFLNAVPGNHRGEVQLRIWRKYRLDGKLLVQELRRRMKDADTNLDEELL